MAQVAESYQDRAVQQVATEDWHFWRALQTDGCAEYVLTAEDASEAECSSMAEIISSLLKGTAAAMVAGEKNGADGFSRALMHTCGNIWQDSRLMARQEGTLFVMVTASPTQDAFERVYDALEQANKYPTSFIRILAYQKDTLPEVRFADLMSPEAEADLELIYSVQKSPMLRIRQNRNTMSDSTVWRRMKKGWIAATTE